MKSLSIRARLTAAYGALLAVVLTGFAFVALEAMRVSALAAADDELRGRVTETRQMSRAALAEHGAELFRIDDPYGRPLVVSNAAQAAGLRAVNGIVSMNIAGQPMRVITAAVGVNRLTIAIPLRPYEQPLARFGTVVSAAIPIALLIAILGGYWLSGRALQPVDAITREARTITARNLDRRLALPEARDELRLLSETLNGMLDRIETSYKRVAQFTADASHELRSPVALMRTTAEVALRRPRDEEEYRDALQQVLREGERLSHLIDDLLLLARSDAGTDVLERAPLDLALPLREAVARVGRPVRQTLDDGVVIDGSATALQQLFAILLDNAVKYTPDGEEIAVRLHARDGHAVVEVRDRGMGIAAEDLPHVFDRFYRADKARSRGGAGLGLAIARRIAEAHGGTVDVTSALGEGSTFTVKLPNWSSRA